MNVAKVPNAGFKSGSWSRIGGGRSVIDITRLFDGQPLEIRMPEKVMDALAKMPTLVGGQSLATVGLGNPLTRGVAMSLVDGDTALETTTDTMTRGIKIGGEKTVDYFDDRLEFSAAMMVLGELPFFEGELLYISLVVAISIVVVIFLHLKETEAKRFQRRTDLDKDDLDSQMHGRLISLQTKWRDHTKISQLESAHWRLVDRVIHIAFGYRDESRFMDVPDAGVSIYFYLLGQKNAIMTQLKPEDQIFLIEVMVDVLESNDRSETVRVWDAVYLSQLVDMLWRDGYKNIALFLIRSGLLGKLKLGQEDRKLTAVLRDADVNIAIGFDLQRRTQIMGDGFIAAVIGHDAVEHDARNDVWGAPSEALLLSGHEISESEAREREFLRIMHSVVKWSWVDPSRETSPLVIYNFSRFIAQTREAIRGGDRIEDIDPGAIDFLIYLLAKSSKLGAFRRWLDGNQRLFVPGVYDDIEQRLD